MTVDKTELLLNVTTNAVRFNNAIIVQNYVLETQEMLNSEIIEGKVNYVLNCTN